MAGQSAAAMMSAVPAGFSQTGIPNVNAQMEPPQGTAGGSELIQHGPSLAAGEMGPSGHSFPTQQIFQMQQQQANFHQQNAIPSGYPMHALPGNVGNQVPQADDKNGSNEFTSDQKSLYSIQPTSDNSQFRSPVLSSYQPNVSQLMMQNGSVPFQSLHQNINQPSSDNMHPNLSTASPVQMQPTDAANLESQQAFQSQGQVQQRLGWQKENLHAHQDNSGNGSQISNVGPVPVMQGSNQIRGPFPSGMHPVRPNNGMENFPSQDKNISAFHSQQMQRPVGPRDMQQSRMQFMDHNNVQQFQSVAINRYRAPSLPNPPDNAPNMIGPQQQSFRPRMHPVPHVMGQPTHAERMPGQNTMTMRAPNANVHQGQGMGGGMRVPMPGPSGMQQTPQPGPPGMRGQTLTRLSGEYGPGMPMRHPGPGPRMVPNFMQMPTPRNQGVRNDMRLAGPDAVRNPGVINQPVPNPAGDPNLRMPNQGMMVARGNFPMGQRFMQQQPGSFPVVPGAAQQRMPTEGSVRPVGPPMGPQMMIPPQFQQHQVNQNTMQPMPSVLHQSPSAVAASHVPAEMKQVENNMVNAQTGNMTNVSMAFPGVQYMAHPSFASAPNVPAGPSGPGMMAMGPQQSTPLIQVFNF